MRSLIHKKNSSRRSGFTLIELSISMLYISLLLIFVASTVTGITAIYKKGISIKKINSLSRDIIEDLTTTIGGSGTLDYEAVCARYYNYNEKPHAYEDCIADKAFAFTYQEYFLSGLYINGEAQADAFPVYGFLCTGEYSYVWNTGYTFDENTFLGSPEHNNRPTYVKVKYALASNTTDIKTTSSHPRLLKLPDPNRVVCASQLAKNITDYDDDDDNAYNHHKNPISYGSVDSTLSADVVNPTISIVNSCISDNPDDPDDLSSCTPYYIAKDPVELISSSKDESGNTLERGGLAIYDLSIYRPAVDVYTRNSYYSGSIVVAILNSGVSVLTGGEYCSPPKTVEKFDYEYCAINKFNFAIHATGGY